MALNKKFKAGSLAAALLFPLIGACSPNSTSELSKTRDSHADSFTRGDLNQDNARQSHVDAGSPPSKSDNSQGTHRGLDQPGQVPQPRVQSSPGPDLNQAREGETFDTGAGSTSNIPGQTNTTPGGAGNLFGVDGRPMQGNR